MRDTIRDVTVRYPRRCVMGHKVQLKPAIDSCISCLSILWDPLQNHSFDWNSSRNFFIFFSFSGFRL